jgi:hypothetical protein
MTLSLEINPDLEERLEARARAAGVPIERFVSDILEREAAAAIPPAPVPTLTGAEKAKAFRKWADSFPDNLPVLSMEDMSRESMYRRED